MCMLLFSSRIAGSSKAFLFEILIILQEISGFFPIQRIRWWAFQLKCYSGDLKTYEATLIYSKHTPYWWSSGGRDPTYGHPIMLPKLCEFTHTRAVSFREAAQTQQARIHYDWHARFHLTPFKGSKTCHPKRCIWVSSSCNQILHIVTQIQYIPILVDICFI